MRRELLILLYQHKTSWMSCLKIHRGLLEAYQATANVTVLYFQDHISDYFKLEEKMSTHHYDAIISLDHRLSPSKVIHYLLDSKFFTPQKTKLILHPFGSIIKLAHDLMLFSKMAKGLDIHFVLPCSEQKKIYDRYILNNSEISTFIPCPIGTVGETILRSSKHLKNLSHGTLKLGYAGRLSRLKNIIPLIDFLGPYLDRGEVELHLVGPFDDYDSPDITLGTGHYMKTVLQKKDSMKNIFYHGVITDESLYYEFLSHLDGFCTLSTNPGEDFCFAVSEALDIGLPCFLNDWMALKDHAVRSTKAILTHFKVNKKQEIIPESIEKDKFEFFLHLCKKRYPAKTHIETQVVSEQLNQIINKSYIAFEGFDAEKLRHYL